jgi:hypothetical protein
MISRTPPTFRAVLTRLLADVRAGRQTLPQAGAELMQADPTLTLVDATDLLRPKQPVNWPALKGAR